MANRNIDPRILALCNRVTAKRPRTMIDHIIEHGSITTEELADRYGYNHAPRAARDVREHGIPLETFYVTSRAGRRMAAYRFDSPDKIKRGRIGGRKAFSKAFRKALIEKHGARDGITGEAWNPRYLQIDHRVPYEVAGDAPGDADNLDAHMLLTASSQRAKSWSCEQCENWKVDGDETMCRSCFWAFPESYTHVAGEHVRRVDIEWRGAEVSAFERLRDRAEREDSTVAAYIKRLLRKAVE